MSLKSNPFDQKSKGNIIRRRGIYTSPEEEKILQDVIPEVITAQSESEQYKRSDSSNQEVTSNQVVTSNSYSNQVVTSNPSSNPSSNQQTTSNHSITSNPSSNLAVTSNHSITSNRESSLDENNQCFHPTEQSSLVADRISFFQLKGFQRQIFLTLASMVQNLQTLSTPLISLEALMEALNLEKSFSKEESLKKSIIKIQKKGLLSKLTFNRSGTSYRVEYFAYLEWTQFKNLNASTTSNRLVTSNEIINNTPVTKQLLVTHPVTHPVTSTSRKVGSYNNIPNYLDGENTSATNTEGWFLKLDFSPVGFKPNIVNKTIRTFVETSLGPVDGQELVQDFVNRYPAWIATQKAPTSPLGLFCEKLKEFSTFKDSPVLSCQTDEEIQAEAALAQKSQEIKAKLDLIAASKEEKIRQELDQNFDSWKSDLTREASLKLVPEKRFAEFGSVAHTALLREYFQNNIYQK